MTSATLSRWLKEVIRQSGIKDIFGGHSAHIILDMTDWSSPSTFNLFHYKPIYQFLIEHLCYFDRRVCSIIVIIRARRAGVIRILK